MHLRLSIVFEKFLKEKNKSEKGNSFAPPAFRLSAAAHPFFQALEGERPSRRRKPRPSRKRRGAAPLPPANFSLDPPFSRARPCQTEGREIGRNEPRRFPARPSFRPYYGSDFFSVEGQSAKRPSVHSLCRKFFMRFQSGLPGPPVKKLYVRLPRGARDLYWIVAFLIGRQKEKTRGERSLALFFHKDSSVYARSVRRSVRSGVSDR